MSWARNRAVLFGALGLVAVALGLVLMVTVDNVECGGKPMRPTDICTEIKKDGSRTSHTYQDVEQKQQRIIWVTLGVGVAALGMAGYYGVMMKRRKRAEQEALAASQQWAAAE